MKKIIKQVSTVSKVLLVTLLLVGFSSDSFAQKKEKKEKKSKKDKTEKVLERPEKVDHPATDSYVGSAFDLYEKNQEISKKLSNASDNADEMDGIKKDLEGQVEEIKALLGKSADVVKQAKEITPKTNSLKAVKAINTGTKALNATQAAIPGQLEMIKKQSGGN